MPQAPEHILALIEGPELYEKSFGVRPAKGFGDFFRSGDVSPDWLAKLHAAPTTTPDPWTFGFAAVDPVSGTVIGTASFKGPPGVDGVVEIAYGIVPSCQGNGFATEVAQALVMYALDSGRVRTVIAHTRPESNASARVLTKCGFANVGEVIDPEDGLVWRWEKPCAGSS